MNEKRSETAVRLAAGAACAFTLATVIEILPSVLQRQQTWPRVSAIGMALAAVLWWAVFFRWKRVRER